MSIKMFQDLSRFTVPDTFRGRSKYFVQLWWLVQSTFFRWSPQFAYEFRNAILRLFGAKIGVGVKVRPTATITYPWKVQIGDHSWIGDDAVLYSLGEIAIGRNSVVSQGSYICAGDHDPADVSFPIRARSILIEDEVWVAAYVFVAPGMTIGRGAIVGARSAVFKDLPAGMICFGSPCRPIKERKTRDV